jgi:peptidoglycan/xylan/chitin deacetylase (PgdA/CDA1 family)
MLDMDKKQLIASTLNYTGFFDTYALLRKLIAHPVAAIIEYHRICPLEQIVGDPNLALSPESFEKHVKYLSTKYEILSIDKLAEYVQLKKRPPRTAAILTFDDGYRDFFLYAYPILERYKLPATIFLVSGYVGSEDLFWWDKVSHAIFQTSITHLDLEGVGKYQIRNQLQKSVANKSIVTILRESPENRRNTLARKLLDICQVDTNGLGRKVHLSWNEIKEMDGKGIEFGAHSVNHPRLPDLSLERANDEIVGSKHALEDNLGKEVAAFCYPYGFYNSEVINLVKQAGFRSAVTDQMPYRMVSVEDNMYCLQRIPGVQNLNKLKAMLCGFVGDVQTHLTKDMSNLVERD